MLLDVTIQLKNTQLKNNPSKLSESLGQKSSEIEQRGRSGSIKKIASCALVGLSLPAVGCDGAPEAVPTQIPAVAAVQNTAQNAAEVFKYVGEDKITIELIKKDLEFFASDANLGRDTGGGKLENEVTEYVERRWIANGVKPAGNLEGTSFRQAFVAVPWTRAQGHLLQLEEHPKNVFGHTLHQLGISYTPDGRPVTSDLLPKSFAEKLSFTAGRHTHNIVGLIEGTDPQLKEEIIVIGAHIDHLGVNRWVEGDNIYNGADDNGSGSAGIMAVVEALTEAKAQGVGPKRTVAVMLFSGEELGLLGSYHWTENPTFDIRRVKGMLNLDMIGRADERQVSTFDNQANGSPNFFRQFEDIDGLVMERVKRDIAQYLRRSDQYPFYRKGIPVKFIFEGLTYGQLNEDYHGLGDSVDKVNLSKARDVTRFAYRHVMGAANADTLE